MPLLALTWGAAGGDGELTAYRARRRADDVCQNS